MQSLLLCGLTHVNPSLDPPRDAYFGQHTMRTMSEGEIRWESVSQTVYFITKYGQSKGLLMIGKYTATLTEISKNTNFSPFFYPD